MARSIDDIVAGMQNSIDNSDDLTVLNSTSNTAIYQLWMKVVAVAVNILEVLFDTFTADVDNRIKMGQMGTAPWWIKTLKAYQLGYALVLGSDWLLTYPVVDQTACIVKYASITKSVSGAITIKVAKDSGGNAVKLTTDEKNGLLSYLNDIEPTGTRKVVISEDADLLNIVGGNFYYNPTYDLSTIKSDFDIAIQTYLKNLDFNGQMHEIKFVDAVETVQGFEDFSYTSLQVKTATATSWTTMSRVYQPYAGYLKMTANFSTLVNFIPNV